MKVCKFGGSSLADAGQVAKVCEIVAADPDRRIVVVSAPGKRHAADSKVTDMLIACAQDRISGGSAAGQIAAVVQRYAEIQEELGLSASLVNAIRADLEARGASADQDPEVLMDLFKAAGEANCAKLVAAALQARGVNAEYVDPGEAGMLLEGEHGQAVPLPETYGNLKKLADRDAVSVFPGFFGKTREGRVITFPRGGSDITGAILAAAVNADLYENFTDVDSVLAVDPRIVPNSRPVANLTYAEMRELSYAGFSVFHDEAIQPAIEAGVPICIKNTNAPLNPGTMIVPARETETDEVVGIASDAGFCTVFIKKYLMNREVGFLRRLFEIFEAEGVSIEHMPSGIDNISVIVRADRFDDATEHRVMHKLKTELGVDEIAVERDLALIMIVGEGMRFHVGIAAKATQALAEAGANIEMMNQGASEISMMFGVKDRDRERAIQSLAKAFF
ncbi:MAG: aspartate kinase [Verrucomicrobia bacterium]|nr:aspartate kinase [Verrucomicrobiota bacterium]MDA1086280.1 aspartate kinase [Verrucomicrobiota bacterium]